MYVKLTNGNVYPAGPIIGNELYIYTKRAEKADGGFQKTEIGYKRKISLQDADVEEYFNLNWIIKLNVGIKGVANEWRLGDDSDLGNNRVILRYGQGNLPGWKQEERGVCSKEYDFSQASGQYVEKMVAVRNGVECRPPKRERKRMTKEGFKKAKAFYDGGNL